METISTGPIIYRIDESNTIYWLSSNWMDFANLNGATESCLPENVIDKKLEAFIEGEQTISLYSTILDHVRSNNKSISFPFRCDAPEYRRFLELEIVPLQNQHVEFRSILRWSEHRKSISLLRQDIDRSNEMLVICSICKRAQQDTQWKEIEEVVRELHLGEPRKAPTLTHSYCDKCLSVVKQSLKRSTNRTSE